MPKTNADLLFEDLLSQSNRFDYLKTFVGRTDQGERELVEYKGEPRDEDLPRIWAKALSGFGNTGGGILIWGLDAPENQPVGLRLVKDVHRLRKRLLQLQPSVLQPAVTGVEVEAIPGDKQASGFVICKIPESRWKPHQVTESKIYYIRSGDNFVPAPHSIVQALFNSNREARIIAQCRLNEELISGEKRITFACWLKNEGPLSAYDLVADLWPSPRFPFPIPPVNKHWQCTQFRPEWITACAKSFLHVGQGRPFLWTALGPREAAENILKNEPLWVKMSLCAKNQAPIRWMVAFSTQNLDH